jgi:two-component system, NarL family, nitrate/nitrite response regulator NarL
LVASDPVRRHGLTAVLAEAGHIVAADSPDVVLFDLEPGVTPPLESEAPVVVLTDRVLAHPTAGVLPRNVNAARLDLALRAVAGGLLVRAPWPGERSGFAPAPEESPLTPRETEILTLIGQGMSNKAVARHLGISVHTVKFHLEALFARLGATNRAEAVAKGLLGGVIEL